MIRSIHPREHSASGGTCREVIGITTTVPDPWQPRGAETPRAEIVVRFA